LRLAGLQESAAEQQCISRNHLIIAEEPLRFQQAVREQELSDRQKECLQLFRLTKSTEDVTYGWYKDRVENRVEGTCNWFLQHAHFQDWLKQLFGPLFVSADPGCGKSVLAKHLVDHVLPKSATVCYFFFKDQDQNTVRQALYALLHQLFSQKEALIQHATRQYEQDGKGLVNSTQSLWKILGDAVQDSQAGSIIIVLDALDECAESEFEDLMRNIESQSRSSPMSNSRVRYLFTSRPYEQIIIATIFGHNTVVQLLLDRGADVNAQGGEYGNALQAASAEGHEQVVKTLLDKGDDVNAQGRLFSNALQATLVKGHKQIVKVLLDRGADIKA
jgi:nucleoside-triphosphatase THEP1